MSDSSWVVVCPGQGAQAIGMGRAWRESHPAARAVFDEADEVLGDRLGAPLSAICADGPADRLNQTDVAQPALYTCGVACFRALAAEHGELSIAAAAGLSLGEYTALHLAGAFSFADGLEIVTERGRLMQEAAVASAGGMVALIGADEDQADEVCEKARDADVLVPANYNAPGQIVLSGHATACERAAAIASDAGLRATVLTVAGAFHSPLMQPAADQLADELAERSFSPLTVPVWSNVTGERHDPAEMELLKQKLVEQIVAPVRWAQSCSAMAESLGEGTIAWHEMAPGAVLRGLMRRIDRSTKVTSHDTP
ncbi:MAG: ACP S-malonyltransferase [Planctomycetota bacterium]